MLFPLQFFLRVLLPAGGTVLVLLALDCWCRGKTPTPAGPLTAALGAGFLVGLTGLSGWPAFPPVSVAHWYWLFVLGSFCIFSLTTLRTVSAGVESLLFVGMLIGLFIALSHPFIRQDWLPLVTGIWIVAVGLMAGFIAVVIMPAGNTPPTGLVWDCMLIALATSVVMGLFHSVILAQTAGVLFAVMVIGGVMHCLILKGTRSRSGIFCIFIFLAGIWIQGYFYSEGPGASIACLMVAALMPGMRHYRQLAGLKPWTRRIVYTAAILAPLMGAVSIAYYEYNKTPPSGW
jgi:hypothetical protein